METEIHKKLCYCISKGGVSYNRRLQLSYISDYMEGFSTEQMLTGRKSRKLLEWARKYHKNYWDEVIGDKSSKYMYK